MNTKKAIDILRNGWAFRFHPMKNPNIIVQMCAANLSDLIIDYNIIKYGTLKSKKRIPNQTKISIENLSIEVKTMIEHLIKEQDRQIEEMNNRK